QTDTFTFDTWSAEAVGTFPVRCSTLLAMDQHPENDTIANNVTVIRRIDAAAISIKMPAGTIDSGVVVVPSARVANLGTSEAMIPVAMQIGTDYSDTTEVFLAPSESTTVFFLAWTASPLGTFGVRCSTMLDRDERPQNDTVSAEVMVVARLDAGVTAIIAPVGPIDSGSIVKPVVRVINNSTGPQDVPVKLQIGTFYTDVRSKHIASGTQDTVQFADWLAIEVGTHAVRCSTMLAGDELSANDTMSTLTTVRVWTDVEAQRLVAPTGFVDSGSVIIPRAVVRNNSTHTQLFPAYMSIGVGYRESTLVLLEPDSSTTLMFPGWAADTLGSFPVCCSVALVGDLDPSNDTVRGQATVVARHDVGCCAIVAPTGTVDSGTVVTPCAVVANYGATQELVPVLMTIGPDYADSRTVVVSPAESVFVEFNDWSAGPAGILAVRCSTALATDTATANDLAVDSVLVLTHPDAAVTDLYCPLGLVDSGTVLTPLCRICNYGPSAAVIPVIMRIGEGYEETRIKYLEPASKDTVRFPGWIALPVGELTVQCSTALTRDERPENDFKTGSVRVRSFRDAAAVQVLAPIGQVDTGATPFPVAVVANYGTSPESIVVRMRITPDYDSTVCVAVEPGEADTVFFPKWTAAITGVHAVRCSTALLGDCQDANDFFDASVTVIARHDAAALEILCPKEVVDSGMTVNPVARIVNLSSSRTEVPVLFRIGADYLRSRRKVLDPGKADTVTFREWCAHPHGYVAVTCSVALAGDEYAKNNAIHESVYVHHQLDAAVLEIIVPSGAVDSGHLVTPKARIANYGPNPIEIPVEMRIGDFYSSNRTKLIPSRGTDTVHFELWIADQIGYHVVRCTTRLEQDENPGNDWRDGAVEVQWRDAATVSIISPGAFVSVGDTCIPKARVHNLGTVVERIPVVFRIGPLYASLAFADSLVPGGWADLEFVPWVVEPGEKMLSCSTALHTDMWPANDKLRATVFGVCRMVVLEPDSACSAAPGSTVDYFLTCMNRGNSADTIDITSRGTRAGWVVQFFDSTGSVPLTDHNANSLPDLGHLAADDSVRFVCRVTVLMTELGRVTDSTEVRATSGSNRTAWDDVRLMTTVRPRLDICIAPDQEGEAQPGRTVTYQLTVTNLGNVEDYADLVLGAPKSRWNHGLTDLEGKQLADRNQNGRPDVGPLAPLGGSGEISLLVTPDPYIQLGERDTATVVAVSFGDSAIQDRVTAVTLVTGGITGLVVEPDQNVSLGLADTVTLRLWVQTFGNIRSCVNLSARSIARGWRTAFFDAEGMNLLRDTDFDSLPDLPRVAPLAKTEFALRVYPPGDRDIAGYPDSLLCSRVIVSASLSGQPAVRDTALIVVTAVPELNVHAYPNPFYDRAKVFFGTPEPGIVHLRVYNRVGECVRQLVTGEDYDAGIHVIEWDGTNASGRHLAPGVYICLLELWPRQSLATRAAYRVIIEPER
ncbi:MAG: hypothetical protein ABIL25_09010, partial [candidate division WOR-3 bacterium]